MRQHGGMAGFALPKFRWLILGALAAGGWAMTQEAPPRLPVEGARQTASRSVEAPAPRRKTVAQAEEASTATPSRAQQPRPRPSDIVTSSIPRPPKPVGAETGVTSAKVRLRAEASTDSKQVTWLKAGAKLKILESKGEWFKVSVDGRKGWVHGDYVSLSTPKPRAPSETSVEQVIAAPAVEPVRKVSSPRSDAPLWGALRPARAPQGGDCQCPYDLMLSGKQCGDHSAYVRKGPQSVQCYF